MVRKYFYKKRFGHWTSAFFLILLLLVLVGNFLLPHSLVHASGGVGDSGGASGGGGRTGAQSVYGYGWYRFATNGPGPEGLRDGGSWAGVQAQCAAANANQIVAFIVFQAPRTVATSIVYRYTSKFVGSIYMGNNGGNWVPYSVAQNEYYSLPAYGVDTSGYTYGGPNGNVSWFCYDYQPREDWNIIVGTSINKTTAAPGDTVSWTHVIRNVGTTTSTGISYGYNSNGGPFGPVVLTGGQQTFSVSSYGITQADVGNTICRETYARPRAWNNSGVVGASNQCVTIPYNYSLNPIVTTDHSQAASVGTQININPAVINTGPTKSKNTNWQLTQFNVAPGTPIPNQSGGVSSSNPCTYFKGSTGCTSPYNNDQGSQVFDATAGGKVSNSTTNLSQTSYTTADLPVGTHVCFSLSVQPNSSSDVNWRYSAPVCLVIAKSPQVDIEGGDLGVGNPFNNATALTSDIYTSTTKVGTSSYGSWGEYAASATGTVHGFASGAAYNTPGGLMNADSCNTSLLIFSNAGSSSCIPPSQQLGNYHSNNSIPDVSAAFSVNGSTPLFNSLADAANKRVETSNQPTININGGIIQAGQWLVLNAPNSTVNITGNINYTTSKLSSLADIPQVVIVANCINVQGSVSEVDAWLISKPGNNCDGIQSGGVINTCSDVPLNAALSSTICNNPLQVNGPVMASHLYLQRTAGAGTGAQAGAPAEIFNLRPDAYLWLMQQSTSSGYIQPIQTIQLPPRF